MYVLVVDILRKSSISKLNHRYLNIKHGKNCAIKILISIVHCNLNTNFRKGGLNFFDDMNFYKMSYL